MNILPYRRVLVADKMPLWITNHYCPTLFGIRGHYDSSYKMNVYVETTNPGSGFFVRSSSSHSYESFVAKEKAKNQPSYWKLVRGKEFDFDTEMRRAQEALESAQHPMKKKILDSYLNVLAMAQEAATLQRQVDALRAKRHRKHKMTSYQRHVLANLKSMMARQQHDVRCVQLYVKDLCTEEAYQRFEPVVNAFAQMTHSHRIWHAPDTVAGSNAMHTVYFDMGIFDFIQSPQMTPMMRDGSGNTYYLYPTFAIRARDGVDFDIIDLKELTLVNHQIPYSSIANAVLACSAKEDSARKHIRHRNYDQFGDGLFVSQGNDAAQEEEHGDRMRERMVGDMHVVNFNSHWYVQDLKSFYNFDQAITSYIANL